MSYGAFGIHNRFFGRTMAAGLLAATMLTSASAAQAKDLCVRFPNQTLVGRNLTIPRPNKCKPFLGHTSGFGGESFALTGSVCTNDAGDRVDFAVSQFFTNVNGLTPQHHAISVDLPGGTGTAELFRSISTGVVRETFPVSIEPCRDSDLRKD